VLKSLEEWRFFYILQAIIQCFNDELSKCDGDTQKFWDNQMNASFCERIWTEIQRRSENWRNILDSEVNINVDFIAEDNQSDNVFLFCIDEARAPISSFKEHNILSFTLFRRALRKVIIHFIFFLVF
jgi:hypothetical protein